jgi:hypothetical protein
VDICGATGGIAACSFGLFQGSFAQISGVYAAQKNLNLTSFRKTSSSACSFEI